MPRAALTTSYSQEPPAAGWLEALDRIIHATEAAELALAAGGDGRPLAERRESGSYYTPADVAAHFWRLFFRHHRLSSSERLKAFIARTDFVEPSAGSGIFVFSFVRHALALGMEPQDLACLRFHVIDINLAALSFIKGKLNELGNALGVHLHHVLPDQIDFRDWAAGSQLRNVAFVGNPPFVANPRGSRWRNLYADFIEAMLRYPAAEKAIGLILPLSVCFSRDYVDLRRLIYASGMGVSASSYDNIPDALFKSGKPESTNSNRANSQRCTILNLGGPDPARREAAPLQRWPVGERASLLGRTPRFHDYGGYALDEQIPRPESARVMTYLAKARRVQPVRALLSRSTPPRFALASVARNFIGIRDLARPKAGLVEIRPSSEEKMLILLQIFSSQLFYEYWRTVGDGFHVTNELVERFPILAELYELCRAKLSLARRAWKGRARFAKEKLNSGKVVRSYDLSEAFEHLRR